MKMMQKKKSGDHLYVGLAKYGYKKHTTIIYEVQN